MATLDHRRPHGDQPAATSRRRIVVITAAAVTLVAGTVVAAVGAFSSDSTLPKTSCSAPASLPGSVVTARLMNLGGTGMHGTSMSGSSMGMGGSVMRQSQWPTFRAGMMRVITSADSLPAGQVSIVAANLGTITHELVVLPLTGTAQVGTRVVAADGKVSEAGSLGETSASCAAGAGDGIAAGSTGWVTVHLEPGRYELVCNLAGHYRAGMYAELDVT